MKILIIDDEKNICSAIKGILTDEGYEQKLIKIFKFILYWQEKSPSEAYFLI